MANLTKYVGAVKSSTKIIDNTAFEGLNTETVTIRREFIIEFKDGERFAFANPEFLEFKNTIKGREDLMAAGLAQNLIDSVLLVWGENTIDANES